MNVSKLIKLLEELEEKPTKKELLTQLFKLLVNDKKDDFVEFKAHLNNNVNCLCAITAYCDCIIKTDFKELEEIIKETGITEEILDEFNKLLMERRNELVLEADAALGVLSSTIYSCFEDKHKKNKDNKPDFDKMNKEELIKYIREQVI